MVLRDGRSTKFLLIWFNFSGHRQFGKLKELKHYLLLISNFNTGEQLNLNFLARTNNNSKEQTRLHIHNDKINKKEGYFSFQTAISLVNIIKSFIIDKIFCTSSGDNTSVITIVTKTPIIA